MVPDTDRYNLTMTLRRMHERITYANVMATLAVFVSLGGASYAAITLPAGSVGHQQLRAHAVGPENLSFPLGYASITDDKTEELAGACPPLTSGPATDLGPPPEEGPTPGREVHLDLQAGGRLVVSATVGLQNESATPTPILVFLELRIDQNEVYRSSVTVARGETVQAPIQASKQVAAGSHTAGLAIESQQQCLGGRGRLVVSNVSLSASAFPLN